MDSKAEQTSLSRYIGDDYFLKHPDWHAADAPGKAKDLEQVVEQVIKDWEMQHQSSSFTLGRVNTN